MELKHSTDSDCAVDKKNAHMRKSQPLGTGLNRQNRSFARDGSDDETENVFSQDGSVRSGAFIPSDTNNKEPSMSDELQEDIPSDSVQIGSDFTKNISLSSTGDRRRAGNQNADKDDNYSSDEVISGDGTPHMRPLMVKSSSLPTMGTPNECTSSFLRFSRSAEDLNVLDSRKKGLMHEVDMHEQYQERDNSESNNGDNNGENLADAADSYMDWIIPASDGENMEKVKGETLNHHVEELPPKDFKLKRIEEWVNELQPCDPLEEHAEPAPCSDGALSKGNALIEESAALKMEIKENPGMAAAKRYISSLSPSATAAQLTNLGLVVIPFLSAFMCLKALNLSGNAIVRISAGALPRGLHILNLSKNSISTIEGLKDLTRLRVLDLSYNRILRIGHGLASCSSLKELYLAGNKISEVEGLHRLLRLNVLDLRSNKLSTAKCLGQLAANYSCLQALSLEGNPSQKNVGDEQLKKYVTSLLPHLTYYNRQSIKSGTLKDTAERSARLGIGAHQMDRGLQVEVKTMRKGSHGIVAQKVPPSSHTSRNQAVGSAKPNKSSRQAFRSPIRGMKTTFGHQFTDFGSKLRKGIRSRSEGNLGAL